MKLPLDLNSKRVALVYDWVNTRHGGAEKVLLALGEIFPQAPLYTSVYDEKSATWAKKFKVVPSFLNKIPYFRSKHQLLVPLVPLAFESFDFSSFDLVISVTSSHAKGVITKPNTTHLCYLLTPPRYLYTHKTHYQKRSLFFQLPVLKQVFNLLTNYLINWDQIASYRPDFTVPISNRVKERAESQYQVTIESPLYPTIIESKDLPNKSVNKEYVLMVSRLVSYKNIDIAIKACKEMKQNLVIVGDGEQKENLEKLAGGNPHIQILGSVSSKKLDQLYTDCLAVLMPGEEDFGIVALEALSYGKPVIINQHSGASELIDQHKTGLLLKKADMQEIKSALLEVKQYEFNPAIMIRCANKHNKISFQKEFIALVSKKLAYEK